MLMSGGAELGKSHVLKKSYGHQQVFIVWRGGNPDNPRNLLSTPTNVTVTNICGITIHRALEIGIGSKLDSLSDKLHKVKLRETFLQIKLIIIDEISMVSSKLFFKQNQRLIEIFGCESNK